MIDLRKIAEMAQIIVQIRDMIPQGLIPHAEVQGPTDPAEKPLSKRIAGRVAKAIETWADVVEALPSASEADLKLYAKETSDALHALAKQIRKGELSTARKPKRKAHGRTTTIEICPMCHTGPCACGTPSAGAS